MATDLRATPVYREVEAYFRALHEPAFGTISGAFDPTPSPDSRAIAFTGTRFEELQGRPTTRVCVADLDTGTFATVTGGPNDCLARWSPDSQMLAFASDRATPGRFQLFLLDRRVLGEARPTPELTGTVEAVEWSPDGRAVLLVAAEPGADVAGAHGSGSTAADAGPPEPWMPIVERVSEEPVGWRRAWVYHVADGTLRPASREGLNVWEASWLGNDELAAVVTESPSENSWYDAVLAVVDVASGKERVLLDVGPDLQLALPAGSPAGDRVAVARAVCSDRCVMAGDLVLVDPATGDAVDVDTNGVDVTALRWANADELVYTGQRGVDTAIGRVQQGDDIIELWASHESCGQRYPESGPFVDGRVALVLESYERYPELVVLDGGEIVPVIAFEHEGARRLRSTAGHVETVRWSAPDGLEIEGLLTVPAGEAPYPLVVLVHGGPVWAWRNRWCMGQNYAALLTRRGFAVLHPNPRGSGGRGQDFARMVYGDMGGADVHDIVSGVEALVERGIADPARVGVTGQSYGAYMTGCLVAASDLFAAAVTISPVSDWYSQHFMSNIPYFDQRFLGGADPTEPGLYRERSPLFHRDRINTPTLHTAGLLDRCTPPNQAVELHHALVERGVPSELVLYPLEGHGVRRFPAVIDQAARIVEWFERYLCAP